MAHDDIEALDKISSNQSRNAISPKIRRLLFIQCLRKQLTTAKV
jgi:hypothetical protein